jgi:hypothetical protein
MEIKLQTGKLVTLHAFHFTTTYGGLIVGEPNEVINNTIIKQISYPANWGIRKAVFDKSDIYSSEFVLKPIIYNAWLKAGPITEQNNHDGSSLVVIWFGEAQKDMSISEIVSSGLGIFDWDNNAENFDC